MPCYHPRAAFLRVRQLYPDRRKNLLWGEYLPPEENPLFWEPVKIPCGECIGCRLDNSRQWADRSLMELESHDSAYFVTLTYDDVHVPVSYFPDPETGEAFPSLTLRRDDVKNFIKRLRKRCGQKIRVFGCGEYGDTTLRPHYHLICFGLKLDDLVVTGKSPIGIPYYTSQLIQDTWSIWHQPEKGQIRGWFEPIGFVSVGEVTWESCAYVARYVNKKVDHDMAAFYETYNVEPEFRISPRRSGLGREYYETHKEQMREYSYFNISTEDGGRKIMPPKYFMDLFEKDYPEDHAKLKEKRKHIAAERDRIKASQTDLSDVERLCVAEETKLAQISALKRDMI